MAASPLGPIELAVASPNLRTPNGKVHHRGLAVPEWSEGSVPTAPSRAAVALTSQPGHGDKPARAQFAQFDFAGPTAPSTARDLADSRGELLGRVLDICRRGHFGRARRLHRQALRVAHAAGRVVGPTRR